MSLSSLRGRVVRDAPLGRESWFGCGGTADLLFAPADIEDLSLFLKSITPVMDIHIAGGLANTIVRDGGIRGCVLRLGKEFADVHVHEDGTVIAGAGALNGSVAAAALKAGIGGLEFLSGIPGSVGGALAMNAGAYGAEVKDVLAQAHLIGAGGEMMVMSPADLAMAYRHTEAPPGAVFASAVFKGTPEGYAPVRERMTEIKQKRNATQPIREKTGGSTFANPSPEELRLAGLPENLRAWQLVERVHGRGLRVGGAQMSEQHCNFMINTGDATAADLENLGDEIRRRVRANLGIELRWEIKRVGAV